MTECERLVRDGHVTSDFFDDEVICDYKVSSKLKKLWAIEADLLREFVRVCDKYRLRWYAYAGTLLGAIRHGGFIPWDDDIDVCMPREDYDILTKELAGEFKTPYFMQTPYTDSEYAFSFAKLRNVNTCMASRAFIESSMNQGVFLDIFPMDSKYARLCDGRVFPDGGEERRERIKEVLRYCSAYMSRNNHFIENKHTEFARSLSFRAGDNIRLYEQIQGIAMEMSSGDGNRFAVEVCTIDSLSRDTYPKECFETYTEMPFFDTVMRIPSGYDELLRIKFGNYMSFPPIEERGIRHNGLIVEPDIPFDVVRVREIKLLSGLK